jgi:polyphenol oxidase
MTPFFNNIFPPEVLTFISCRPHDFSLSATQNDMTEEKKRFLSEQLGFAITKVMNIRQVHGDKIIIVSKHKPYISPSVLEEADGMITTALNFPIVIRTADCVPVFLYDRQKKQIGLFHAGWKGTQKQILFKGLKLMEAKPQDVTIGFGPAIRECCYEVGTDVRECFPEDIIRKEQKYYLDLVKGNIKQALAFGVLEKNIVDCGLCTCCNERYFSYRREGERAGRNISLMMLKE